MVPRLAETGRRSSGAALGAWGRRHRGRALGLAGALLVPTLLLGAYTLRRGPLPGEAGLFDAPLRVPPGARQIADAAAFLVGLGAPLVAAALVLLLAAVVLELDGRAGALLIVLAAAAAPIASVLKAGYGKQAIQHLVPVAHYPSGHVAFVAAVFGMTGLLALARRRVLVACCCVVPVGGIGPAVLIEGGHVASDVAGGYLLAAAWILTCLVLAGAVGGREAPWP
jgi:membrane-associated phospholipid phosphatase